MNKTQPIKLLHKFSTILILLGYFIFSFNATFANSTSNSNVSLQNKTVLSVNCHKAHFASQSTNNQVDNNLLLDLFTELELEDIIDADVICASNDYNFLYSKLLEVKLTNFQNSINNITETPLFILYCNWKTFIS